MAPGREVDVVGNVAEYLRERTLDARYSSFDFCFNYFRSHFDRDGGAALASDEYLERSCLHLGFYLASWGMYRGSSQLLRQSAHRLAPVIDVVGGTSKDVWDIDVEDYDEAVIQLLIETGGRVRNALDSATDTLVTKVMLGVFGCVPAFDSRFRRGFRTSGFTRKALREVAEFRRQNDQPIEGAREPTLDFSSGDPTGWRYTQAKVIDMVFFVEGAP